MAAKLLTKLANAKSLYWHYFEAGHGKGAPDGVGGCIKRTADNIVARGIDIPDLNTFMEQLKINCKGIKMFQVSEKEIDEINFEEVIPTFAGTLKTHQISCCEDSANVINIRRLTCCECQADQNCLHYGIGQIFLRDNDDLPLKKKRFRYEDV